ncbi:MAG: hypothetical protein AAF628_11690 [Planctomycetota bacterium]
MSRALINDPKLNRYIAANFVPVAASIERLQPSRYGGDESDSSRWFGRVAERAFAEFAPPGWWDTFQTYQGFYVVGHDGAVFDYKVAWGLEPDDMTDALAEASTQYRRHPPRRVVISDHVVRQAEHVLPKSVAGALRVFNRVTTETRSDTDAHNGIGRDHAWIYREDVIAILDAGRQIRQRFDLPAALVARLVRFHLLDHARNVSEDFDADQVQKAQFRARCIAVEGDLATFSVQGTYRSEGRTQEDGEAFGVVGTIDLRFVLDRSTKRVARFRGYGRATAWGQTGNGAPPGRYGVEFALVDVDDAISAAVPPFYAGLNPAAAALYRTPTVDAAPGR